MHFYDCIVLYVFLYRCHLFYVALLQCFVSNVIFQISNFSFKFYESSVLYVKFLSILCVSCLVPNVLLFLLIFFVYYICDGFIPCSFEISLFSML